MEPAQGLRASPGSWIQQEQAQEDRDVPADEESPGVSWKLSVRSALSVMATVDEFQPLVHLAHQGHLKRPRAASHSAPWPSFVYAQALPASVRMFNEGSQMLAGKAKFSGEFSKVHIWGAMTCQIRNRGERQMSFLACVFSDFYLRDLGCGLGQWPLSWLGLACWFLVF